MSKSKFTQFVRPYTVIVALHCIIYTTIKKAALGKHFLHKISYKYISDTGSYF